MPDMESLNLYAIEDGDVLGTLETHAWAIGRSADVEISRQAAKRLTEQLGCKIVIERDDVRGRSFVSINTWDGRLRIYSEQPPAASLPEQAS